MAVTLAMALASLALLAPGGSAAPPDSRLFSSVNVLFSSPLHPKDAARMARGGIRTARLSFDWWGVEGVPTSTTGASSTAGSATSQARA